MKNNLKILFVFVCVIIAQGIAVAQPQTLDKIIAKIEDKIVLLSDYEKGVLQTKMSGAGFIGSDDKCRILEALIINKMMVAKAEIDSVLVDPDMVDESLERRMEQILAENNWTEKDLIENFGRTSESLKEEYRSSIEEQLIIQKMQGEITKSVTITPAEVKQFFKRIPSDSLPFFSTEVEVGHIVISPDYSQVEKDKARKKLELLRERVLDGEDMEELAMLYSEDPGSARNGGELGMFERGQLVPPYEAAALAMEPGEYSEIVESQFGFHFIQLIERRGNKFNTRHILIKPKITPGDLKQTEAFLDSLRQELVNGTIKFDKAANDYSEDPFTKNNGGFFSSGQDGSSRISMDAMDPELFFVIDTMSVGQISRPVPYKLADGTEARRIVYYKSRVRAHKANLNDDYQKIRNAALANKKNEVLNKWFMETLKEISVDIDEEYKHCDILKQAN